jgi:hypothetical protein
MCNMCRKRARTLRMYRVFAVDSGWNVVAHGDTREGKWRGNWRMKCVASTLHTTSEHGVSSITTADAHTSAAGIQTDAPANLNGLAHFAERWNPVSARVPSHFKCSLPPTTFTNPLPKPNINIFDLFQQSFSLMTRSQERLTSYDFHGRWKLPLTVNVQYTVGRQIQLQSLQLYF